jgi:hypothetical protein
MRPARGRITHPPLGAGWVWFEFWVLVRCHLPMSTLTEVLSGQPGICRMAHRPRSS